jgi:prepilin-type processing-associated H-X9-DG protein
MQYSQDYDEGLPAWREREGTPNPTLTGEPGSFGAGIGDGITSSGSWQAKLFPYMKSGTPGTPSRNTGVWHCPSQGSIGDLAKNTDDSLPPSYGMSMHIAEWNTRGLAAMRKYPTLTYFQYPRITEMDIPAMTIFVGDGGSQNNRIGSPRGEQFLNVAANASQSATDRAANGPENLKWETPTRHMGGANYLFADGHAKWLNREVTYPTAVPGTAAATAAEWWAIYNYFSYNETERTGARTLCGARCQ